MRDERERHHEEQPHHVRRGRAQAEVRAVAEHRPEQELARPDEQRDDRDRDREPDRGVRDAALPTRSPDEVEHGEQRRRARLLRKGGDCHRDPGRARSIARAQEDRRGHRRQHEHLEVRGLPVLGRERDRREDEEDPGEPSRSVAVPASGFQREEQRGQGDREHRDDAHGPQRAGREQAERRRVEVRDQRRLAVGRVLVEPPALVDDLGLGGEERLVGVEDLDEERPGAGARR